MGAKLYANTSTKELIITLSPDVNDQININVQVDMWSDLQIDWENDVNLRKHTFPLVAIGGQTISAGKLGTTYVLLTPWQIAPYEANHDLTIDGNLFTESALTNLVLPTTGTYTVSVNRELSTLVEVVETVDAAAINTKLDAIDMFMQKIDARDEGSHVTYTQGANASTLVIRNSTVMRRWEAPLFSDEDGNNPYTGEGLPFVGEMTEVAWS